MEINLSDLRKAIDESLAQVLPQRPGDLGEDVKVKDQKPIQAIASEKTPENHKGILNPGQQVNL